MLLSRTWPKNFLPGRQGKNQCLLQGFVEQSQTSPLITHGLCNYGVTFFCDHRTFPSSSIKPRKSGVGTKNKVKFEDPVVDSSQKKEVQRKKIDCVPNDYKDIPSH